MERLQHRTKLSLVSFSVLDLIVLLILIMATDALGGIWLPGQQASSDIEAPRALDAMYRPSFKTLPIQMLPTPKPKPRPPVTPRSAPVQSGERCGGSLPSCSIMACESGGDLRVRNHAGSSATGKWQITKGTWNGYRGFAEARDAPEHIQDEKARELKRARGDQPWAACL